ncbi:hypothetical protein KDH_80140 [Dictyobacter sp. S3.2.2.5]|uniref:HNH nuclease domain-containing protein n=1 Tax=Dictyobacter halimunensis TaxID=3026934 RepID=A0ABQ6G5A2_9CHLR|nr:hypothetical protein KDH_80140 [Dictyobacter sp. S3.2.2.5]
MDDEKKLVKSQVLVPVDERVVDFYDDQITTALVQVGDSTQMFVPLRPICEHLGLTWSGQYERLKRDPVLAEEVRFVRFTRPRGGNPVLICLPIDFFHGWLFGISSSRVNPQWAPKILRYKRECFRLLWNTFQSTLVSGHPLVPAYTDSEFDIYCYPLTPQQILEAVKSQCARAKDQGLPATLTVSQWCNTLKAFYGLCAYCRKKPGIVIEHYIPLTSGGGTTADNCVPSCFSCNSRKGNKHPHQCSFVSHVIIEDVLNTFNYLEPGNSDVLHERII